jgi:hypothetical protein
VASDVLVHLLVHVLVLVLVLVLVNGDRRQGEPVLDPCAGTTRARGIRRIF